MHRQRQAFGQRKRSVKEEEETEEFEEEGSKEDGEKAPAAKRRKVFTDILAGFTVNNRVLRLPAIEESSKEPV